jgi:Maf-like protein
MLVLASASPRRQELLRNAGIAFEVQPADILERQVPGESAKDCAERLAREKALVVASRRPNAGVLGADTVVVIDGQLLGKPHNDIDAARMLRLLSGRTHAVITGVCLVINGQTKVASEKKSTTTSPRANLWTRRAPTRSKASPHVGFLASKATTAMWWDCQWRWSGGFYKSLKTVPSSRFPVLSNPPVRRP